jgi:hypothetical protein
MVTLEMYILLMRKTYTKSIRLHTFYRCFLFSFCLLGFFFTIVPTSIVYGQNLQITIPPLNCTYKQKGDADCMTDSLGKHVTWNDYLIWEHEYLNACSITAIGNCAVDIDQNTSAMDANFNYVGSNQLFTDYEVDLLDYSLWYIGFYAENSSPPLPLRYQSPRSRLLS